MRGKTTSGRNRLREQAARGKRRAIGWSEASVIGKCAWALNTRICRRDQPRPMAGKHGRGRKEPCCGSPFRLSPLPCWPPTRMHAGVGAVARNRSSC